MQRARHTAKDNVCPHGCDGAVRSRKMTKRFVEGLHMHRMRRRLESACGHYQDKQTLEHMLRQCDGLQSFIWRSGRSQPAAAGSCMRGAGSQPVHHSAAYSFDSQTGTVLALQLCPSPGGRSACLKVGGTASAGSSRPMLQDAYDVHEALT